MATSGTDSGSVDPNATAPAPSSPTQPESPRRSVTTTATAIGPHPTPPRQRPPTPTPPRRRSISAMLGHMLQSTSGMGLSGPGAPPPGEAAEGSGSGGGTTTAAAALNVIRQADNLLNRKRSLEAGEGSSGLRRPQASAEQQEQQQQQQQNVPPPPPPPPPAVQNYRCSICAREFQTAKGLFGHMRSHPDRGWRGAYPPPAFNREEFADLAVQANPEDNIGAHEADAGRGAIDINREPDVADPPNPEYRLPDLNNPPPPEMDD